MPIEPPKIWAGWVLIDPGVRPEGGDKLRAFNRKVKIRGEQTHLLGILDRTSSALLFGMPNALDAQVKEILAEISKGGDGHAIRRNHNFFVRGLLEGVKQGLWDVNVPPPMVVLHRRGSPFTPDKFYALRALNRLMPLFNNSLEDESFFSIEANKFTKRIRTHKRSQPVDAYQLQAGQIIFSAIVHGALLSPYWLDFLGRAIKKNVVIDGSHLWLDLVNGEEGVSAKLRRWHPDPLTGLLLLRWRKTYGAMWPEGVGQCISRQTEVLLNRFLRSLGIEKDETPTKTELISAASTRLGLRMPPFLVEYAAKRDIAPSLPVIAWGRFLRDQVPQEMSSESGSKEVSNILHKESFSCQFGEYPDQLVRFRRLQKILGGYHYKRATSVAKISGSIEAFLQENIEGMAANSSILHALAEWSLFMMRSGSLAGVRLKPSSMRTYLSAIGKHLVVNSAGVVLEELSIDDYVALYEKVIEVAPNASNKSVKASRLMEFHSFLVRKYGAPQVEIEGAGGVAGRVDCNLVTLQEYIRARNCLLVDSSQPERLRKIQSLLLMLGFRCGLRRNEALTLHLRDLQNELDPEGIELVENFRPELLIRNNSHGRVKSEKSKRRLPLSILLSAKEWQELNKWKLIREQEISSKKQSNALLFCSAGENDQLLHDKETFLVIQKALRKVSRDSSLRFHHLRHAFANYMLLRLLNHDYENLMLRHWVESDDQIGNPLSGEKVRSRLLLSREAAPSRRLLYGLSQLCGHLDPSETLSSYLHTVDWVLGAELRRAPVLLSKEMQAAILNLTPGSLKQYRNRFKLKGENGALALLKVEMQRSAMAFNDPSTALMQEPEEISPPSLNLTARPEISPFVLYEILKRRALGESVETVATRFDYSEADLKLWERRSRKLASLKTPRGASRFIRKEKNGKVMIDLSRIRRCAIPGYCPALPHNIAARDECLSVFSKMRELHKIEPKHVGDVLELFLKRSSSAKTSLKVQNNDEARLYVAFLSKMGVARHRFRVDLEVGSNRYRSEELKKCAKALGLPKCSIHVTLNGKRSLERPGFGGKTIWLAGKEKAQEGNKQLRNESGLRFALYMGLVVFGFL